MSKVCARCPRPDRTFAKNSKSADGLQSWCKDCMREYMRGRPSDPEKRRANAKRSATLHPDRRRARERVKDAVRRGDLPRVSTLACVDCGWPAGAYDHVHGYAEENALDVEPVCHTCHGLRSRARGEHARRAA